MNQQDNCFLVKNVIRSTNYIESVKSRTIKQASDFKYSNGAILTFDQKLDLTFVRKR